MNYLPKPLAETTRTVTLARSDFEALREALEDARDKTILAGARAREREMGRKAARADAWPLDLVERRLKGESAVRLWREHRGLGLRLLAKKAGVGAGYLSEIEAGRKPGSFAALAKLAKALAISLDELAP
ncbi:MAG: helix-turn-helix transcriptional regulator [Alphaproteobacteria bacterium]|nr:helix-turn-helix transcriptional regulator [Alphaproteobacteria bacterium]